MRWSDPSHGSDNAHPCREQHEMTLLQPLQRQCQSGCDGVVGAIGNVLGTGSSVESVKATRLSSRHVVRRRIRINCGLTRELKESFVDGSVWLAPAHAD